MSANFRYTVLVADDDRFIREKLKATLENDGRAVVAVKSGEDALEFMKEHIIDLVIVDVHMEGMTGIDVLKEIRKRNREIPVIVMSADERIEVEREARENGVFSFFMKPIEIQIFEKTVKSALEFGKNRV